jgi:hypothetical protein
MLHRRENSRMAFAIPEFLDDLAMANAIGRFSGI